MHGRHHITVKSLLINASTKRYLVRAFTSCRKMEEVDYSSWDVDQLVTKVKMLEKDLKEANARYQAFVNPQSADSTPKHGKAPSQCRIFDPSRYSTRMIALKFAYLGQKYHGLEYSPSSITPHPTVEEVLWTALMKAKLIFPTNEEAVAAGQVTWEGCDYTKCGRTDKGVSAFGQVIGLRVRSNRPLAGQRRERKQTFENGTQQQEQDEIEVPTEDVELPFDPVRDEIAYISVINRLLPPDIRVLAWCSDLPEDFSARFSCRERRYRYFFTNPAFTPTYGTAGIAGSKTVDAHGSPRREGWLDIKAMQDAAKRYEGLHDFRNLCKIDASKQIVDHTRRIFLSEIQEVDRQSATYVTAKAFAESSAASPSNDTDSLANSGPKVYQFVLHGSAFLWHQVRHMIAILFLVGQGLEKPDIVDKLMDAEICPQKPHYEMAEDAPLVLWDCIFPDLDSHSRKDAMNWIYAGDTTVSHRPSPGKYGVPGLVDSLWEVWRQRKIDEILAGSLLNLVVSQGSNPDPGVKHNPRKSKLYLGGNSVNPKGPYVPLLKRSVGEHFEVVNEMYARRKGLPQRTAEEIEEWRNQKRDQRQDHLLGVYTE